MNILALDLGSTTGYAYGDCVERLITGSKTWADAKELREAKKNRMDRRRDVRVVRFLNWLSNLRLHYSFDLVIFEDVQFHTSLAQSQLWSSFRATAWSAFPSTLFEAVPVNTLKKFATGSGSADKNQMAKSLFQKHPEFYPVVQHSNHDAIDASWLWVWGQKSFERLNVKTIQNFLTGI